MAPHSSTLAWQLLSTEEPGRLQSMGSLRVGHDWATSLSFFTFCIREGNGTPLQCFCLENPRDWGAWWASVYGVAQSRTQLKRLSSSSSSVQYYPYLKVHQWAWEERERRSHTVVWDFQFWCGEVNRKVTEEERGLKKLWSDHQDQRALGLFGGVFFERFKT